MYKNKINNGSNQIYNLWRDLIWIVIALGAYCCLFLMLYRVIGGAVAAFGVLPVDINFCQFKSDR